MPPYQMTVFYRPMLKETLVDAIKRTATKLLDNGAVIIDLKSLGYRDLAVRTRSRKTNEPVYTCNSILFDISMPQQAIEQATKQLKEDADMLKIGIVNMNRKAELPNECDLASLLKPPAYRETVEELRKKKKMSYLMAFKTYKKTEAAFRNIPKSYWVSPTNY